MELFSDEGYVGAICSRAPLPGTDFGFCPSGVTGTAFYICAFLQVHEYCDRKVLFVPSAAFGAPTSVGRTPKARAVANRPWVSTVTV